MSFLDYTGKFTTSRDKFIFKMKGGKKKTSKFSTIIFNPTYDNSFKTIFCFHKGIVKSLLNSVLFPGTKLIEKIEYSKTHFPGILDINSRYGACSKSIDVGCKCFLKKDNNLNIKNNVLMIDLEMQIGFNDEVESRFINYANTIRVKSKFADTWVVSFIVKESINSENNIIEFDKKNSEGVVNVKKYQEIKIIEINLNHCYSLIKENKDIKIFDELGQEGKEWIKLLSVPLWCQQYDLSEDIYVIPKHTQKGFISCNYVKKAIEEIIYRPNVFDLSSVDEYHNKEERKENYLLKKENKILKEKLKKSEEKLKKYEEKEKEEDYPDIDDENDKEDNDQKSDDEEEEEEDDEDEDKDEDEDEDEDRKNNKSKDEDAQNYMDIED